MLNNDSQKQHSQTISWVLDALDDVEDSFRHNFADKEPPDQTRAFYDLIEEIRQYLRERGTLLFKESR